MNSNNFAKEKQKILKLFKDKKYLEVSKLGFRLYKQTPNDIDLVQILGLTLINTQNFSEAENYFKKLLKLKKSAEAYYTLGNIQKKIKKYDNAISSFENALKLNPKFSEAFNNLGNTKKLIHKRDEAISHYKKAISLKEDNIPALINLSIILKENNNYKELISVYEKILNLDSKNIKTIYNLGTAHLFLGNSIKSRKCFEKVIELDNLNIPSFRNYVSITSINKTDKIFKQFEKIDLSKLDHINKILILDALSKCYFDLNKVDLAFNCLERSNLLKKEQSKFSMHDEENLFQRIKLLFSKINNDELRHDNKIERTPIFIVGMPRSGTSLIEQILSTHSKIYGAGELNYFQQIVIKAGLKIPNNNHNYFEDIRKSYYEKINKISKSTFIIDKLPSNFRWVGFIIKSFPEAKIIHIKRNPMAVCWSNYKTFFIDQGLDFNLTQRDVAKYYSMYSNLMNFWNNKFKNNIFTVNYEIFVSNFEQNTKKILTYLDLQWEDQLLEYAKTSRPVTTASHHQVREKIKKDTSDQWKKYTNYLGTMRETLTSLKIKY